MPACSVCGQNFVHCCPIRVIDARLKDTETFMRAWFIEHFPDAKILHSNKDWVHAVNGDDHVLVSIEIDWLAFMQLVENEACELSKTASDFIDEFIDIANPARATGQGDEEGERDD